MKTFGTHNYFVYILTNYNKTTLYIGVTNNITTRLHYHRNPENEQTFTTKYKCHYLVYYEHFEYIEQAIAREKELKGWKRSKKDSLIASFNPDWSFLNDQFE